MWRRYPCVRQHDESDCGAAALATVALCYSMPVSLQQLRDLAGTDQVGTNLLGMVDAAERLGFAAKAIKGVGDVLSEVPVPAIAHITTAEGLGHFVVIHRVNGKGVVLADPSVGLRRMGREEFEQMWTGYLILVAPDPGRDRKSRLGQPVSAWRRFTGLVAAHRGLLTEALCCALLMTLLGLSTSYFVQHLVDSVLVRGELQLLNALGVGMGVVIAFRVLFGALRHYLLAHIGRRIDLTLISSYARHLLSLPMSFFETRRIGEIISRVSDAGKVREAVSGAALTVVVDGALVVVTTAVLWFYDVPLAIVSGSFGALIVISVLLHHPASRRRSREAMENGAQHSAHLVEDVSGVETVKAYGAQPHRIEEGERRLVRVAKSIFSMEMLRVSMSTTGGLISAVSGLVVLWYGGHRVIEGALTVGQLMFFYTLLGYMLGPLERLASVNLQIQDALVAVDRLQQVMGLDIEDDGAGKARLDSVDAGIELSAVGFRYGCRQNVLEDVDLSIAAGSTVAIVGESGCGKSTLLKLLMRFYDPTAGRVMIDGVDVRDLDLDSLRSAIGLVSQDPFIFNGTVRENISLGAPHANFDDVINAARMAGLDDFINDLPERYETMLGERGANLSGGQRQRLSIARALLRRPRILLFDEATSHLDTTTERAIQDNLKGVFAETTVVLVAHRLSTIREADLIVVMHEGRIVERGDHQQLIATGGRYASLWRSQVGDNDHALRREQSVLSRARIATNGNGHASRAPASY